MKKAPTIITGTVGKDVHVVGTRVVTHALKEAGFNVVALGIQTSPDEFIRAAQETSADAILMTSLYGMAAIDLKGFNKKRLEAGLGDVLLYIGGNLVIGRSDYKEVEKEFKALGFDRVYPPEADIVAIIETDLKGDLRLKRKM
jgi:methylaspartate mutase S subunit